MSIQWSEIISKCHTSKLSGMKPKSTPSASRSPSRSTCLGGASFRPFKLSVITGGRALLSMIGVSRVGFEDRFELEDDRLGGLNVFLSFSANGASLLNYDARRASSSPLRAIACDASVGKTWRTSASRASGRLCRVGERIHELMRSVSRGYSVCIVFFVKVVDT
jgi:hypothetical protein